MISPQRLKRLKFIIGVFFATLAAVLCLWLVLLMAGYPVDISVFGLKPSFTNYVRFLAEFVVAALLLAALAFL